MTITTTTDISRTCPGRLPDNPSHTLLTMVSHQNTGSNVTTIRASRGPTTATRDTGVGGEMKELDSIYQSHPIPSMPSRLLGPQQRPLGDSMLAYTERMREITKFRKDSALLPSDSSSGNAGTVLEVQARHIPRNNPAPPDGKKGKFQSLNTSKPRRPRSLDELIGRHVKEPAISNSTTTSGKQQHKGRPLSEPPVSEKTPSVRIPTGGSITPQADNSGCCGGSPDKQIRISFVSAADLFDLVDFSIRSKKSRNESVKLSRAEDTLRLINEANFFRSMPAKIIAKPGTSMGEDDEIDRASLLAQGSSSPRDVQGGDSQRDVAWTATIVNPTTTPTTSRRSVGGDWARRETRRLSDPYDSDDEGAEFDNDSDDDDDDDDDFRMDLLHEKRLLLSQPQKLRFRPKRAKRMKLHASRLSAIPEDDRHRQDALSAAHTQHQAQTQPEVQAQTNAQTQPQTQAQEQSQDVYSSMRLPVIPTHTSLAAIKGSRKNDIDKTSNSNDTRQFSQGGDNAHSSEDMTMHRQSLDAATDTDRNYGRLAKSHKKNGAAALRDTGLRVVLPNPTSKKRHSLKEDSSSPRKPESQRGSVGDGGVVSQAVLSGQSVVLETPSPRAKAQKKFRKLIFLRDQPEQIYHRYS